LALQAQGRDQELRLIRGELSASRDCRGAIADFDRILLQGPPEALMERALHGRAACRLRLGDVDGAMADLDLYLRQYPNGRFAAEARRAKATATPAGGR
jgi:regulator of sirC expression with transglutaminase-like and TPR domain